MSTLDYIRNFIKDRDVASLTPTSERTVKNICSRIDFSRDLFLVEYGPGDGVFSRYLLSRMTPGSRLVLIESNENFVRHLQETLDDPRVEIHNVSAGDITQILTGKDIGNVDIVLSGIPFSFLNENRRMKVLEATRMILKEEGIFMAYQTGSHLKKPLMKVFGNLNTDREILNIPPYVIYEAQKRKSGTLNGRQV